MTAISVKYRCDACNSLFDEPSVHRYREDMNGEGAYQTFFVETCPCCGSEEIKPLPEPEDDDEEAMEALDRMVDDRREWEELHT